ncbi:hypothetical protein WNY58_08245 [Neptuniibacter pectenicola]|jgi:hypothetical protein|uniref:Motility protein n=1 Tax=Neptuniibacter pectenicola TaxID=1806669 RepID=A0ABU9TRM2_9GAMM|nr:hypothetical protein [Neptuniibacter pectenicola]|tara:strand:+ start:342 stop:551 length:210 start_codon:yes stop_codon:yes gene_type:complete
MEVNEISASASIANEPTLPTSHAIKSAEMAQHKREQTGEQVMQLLEVTAPGKLRTDPLSPLGSLLDVTA